MHQEIPDNMRIFIGKIIMI